MRWCLIRSLHHDGDLTLVAIDQPTIVPNQNSMRPAERVVAGTIIWSGGGIQPAYRDKAAMFGDKAPDLALPRRTRLHGRSGGRRPGRRRTLRHGSVSRLGAAEPRRDLRRRQAAPPLQSSGQELPAGRLARRPSPPPRRKPNASVSPSLPHGAPRSMLTRSPARPTRTGSTRVLCLLIAARWRRERERCAMTGDLASRLHRRTGLAAGAGAA